MALIDYRTLNSRPSVTCKMSEAGLGAASTEPSVDLPVDGKGGKPGLPSRYGEKRV